MTTSGNPPSRSHNALGLLLMAVTSLVTASEPATTVRLTTDGVLKQRPMWSPDGKWLVFTRHQGASIQLWLRSADGAEERRLTENKDPEFDACFSPDSQRLLFSFDKTSPNQGDIDIHQVGVDGKSPTVCVATKGQLSHEEWPTWSPDGRRFAFTSTRYGNQELCIAQVDGTGETRLTSDPALDVHPSWSPDGRRIAFATDRWGDLEIAVIDADGKNLTRLTTSRGLDDYPAWSPDGQWLAFVTNRDGNQEVYVMDPEGKRLRNMTEQPGIDTFPSFTPDGRLTWVAQREAGFDVYVAGAPFAVP